VRIGHAIRGVDALLFGHGGSFCFRLLYRFKGAVPGGPGRGWDAVSGALSKGPPRPIAKQARIPADRPHHPWRGRFALWAWRVFLFQAFVSL